LGADRPFSGESIAKAVDLFEDALHEAEEKAERMQRTINAGSNGAPLSDQNILESEAKERLDALGEDATMRINPRPRLSQAARTKLTRVLIGLLKRLIVAGVLNISTEA